MNVESQDERVEKGTKGFRSKAAKLGFSTLPQEKWRFCEFR